MNGEIRERIYQIDKGIVPEGYKKTKIGVIPEDWEVKKLSDISKINTGLTPLRRKLQYFDGNTPWVKTGDLNNSYITGAEENVTELALKETSLKPVKKNSVLIAMYGGFNQIGRTGLMKIDGTTNQAISSLYIDEIDYNSEYVLNYLNLYRGYWKGFASSSRKDPNITKKDVENFPIAQPKYIEQEKIADILSLWDEAIETTEKLIKEKEIQKKGLMQELLTGKTRLPGFNREWEIKKFETEFKVSQGLQIPIKDRYKKEIDNSYVYITNEYINNAKNKKYKKEYILEPKSNVICSKEDILMTRTGNTGIVLSGVEGVFHNNFFKIDYNKEEYNQDFLVYLLKGSYIQHEISRLAGTSTIPDLTHSDFYSLVNLTPSLTEQKAIVTILSDADNEIELLKQLLSNKKQEKKGLMQVLLTGIVRV